MNAHDYPGEAQYRAECDRCGCDFGAPNLDDMIRCLTDEGPGNPDGLTSPCTYCDRPGWGEGRVDAALCKLCADAFTAWWEAGKGASDGQPS